MFDGKDSGRVSGGYLTLTWATTPSDFEGWPCEEVATTRKLVSEPWVAKRVALTLTYRSAESPGAR